MTKAETETVIQFDDASGEATVYTHHKRWQNRLHKLGLTPEETNGHGGMTFRLPKRWLRLPVRPRRLQTGDFSSRNPPLEGVGAAKSEKTTAGIAGPYLKSHDV